MAATTSKTKKVFVCTECDHQSPRWMGQCPSCQSWNTMVEETYTPPVPSAKGSERASLIPKGESEGAVLFSDMALPEYIRSKTGIAELDRVLGGGLVNGSAVLLAGEPGIGKSTLLMQICGGGLQRADQQKAKILYVSGEESKGQLKLRASRLGISGENLYVLTDTDMTSIVEQYKKIAPDVIIVDSIQTMVSPRSNSSPGSIAQVRECALSFIDVAKTTGSAVIIVGHVNKEGGIAGPKVLEHMVDAVLSFEGDRQQSYRIIRAIKNRYGSTNEIGVFEMTENGLCEVPNPSETLLSGRPSGVPGSCAVCIMEGTRPILAEIQALVTQTVFPAPRRTSIGMDYNRICLILAVLEKRLGLKLGACDVYMNVAGGLRLDEPAGDIAAAMAIISSLRDKVIPDNLIAIGEIGLAGECRSVSAIEQRIGEAARIGFTKILVPKRSIEKRTITIPGVEIIPIGSIYDILKFLS